MPDLEGWIDKLYVRIYDPRVRTEINLGYKSGEYIPGHEIIGSSDLGDALVIEEISGKLFWIPFVPLDVDHKYSAYESLEELKRITEEKMLVNDPAKDPQYGLEVAYKHPVVLGGDMWNKDNVVFPPREKHMEMCALWNQVYYRMKKERG